MNPDVRRYVESCVICQKEKGTSSNASLYQPLPIHTRPWECLTMDFIVGLPKKRQGMYSMYFCVDRFRKMDHFVPCKTTNDATQIASSFFK